MPLEDAMAASSRDDIPRQLAALLGRESVCQIRKTDTVPPRISVIDVVEAITGQVKSNAGKNARAHQREPPRGLSKLDKLPFSWQRAEGDAHC